jgi:hypothetical protein
MEYKQRGQSSFERSRKSGSTNGVLFFETGTTATNLVSRRMKKLDVKEIWYEDVDWLL